MKKLPKQPIQGIIDGIAVLQYLAVSSEPLSGLSISKQLGIEKTKVNRVLKTLSHLEIVYRTKERKYTPGPGMHVLSTQMIFGSGLIQNSLKHLIQLTCIKHIVAMGMLWRDNVSYLYHWTSGISPAEGLGRVSLFPASQSSIGLILLSDKTDKDIRNLYMNNVIPGFRNIDQLLSELDNIRKKNYASTYFEEKRSLAVRVGNPAFAAIALSGKFTPAKDQEYLELLINTKTKIEREIK